MWFLGQIKGRELYEVAKNLSIDEAQVRRWVNGYDWDSKNCEPRPIRYVRLSTVDKISIEMGDPGMLNRLYGD